MLIQSNGLVSALAQRADNDGSHVTPARSQVQRVRFVKDDDEQPVFLEHRALYDRVDIRLQPSVGGGQGAVMRVVAQVWDDEGILG